MTLDKVRGRLMLSLVLGALVFVGLSAYADFSDVVHSLGKFRWEYLPLVLALTSMNYVLRFFKWQFYLGTIGVEDFPRTDSALTYLSGLGMAITPGKVGEWLKCYLLRELHGTQFSRSAPIVIAERLTDMLGLVILGAAGLAVFHDSWPAFVVVIVGCAALVIIARNQPLSYWILHRLERLPVISRFAHHAEDFYASSYVLLSPVALVSMTLLSVVSWGFEVLGFFVVLLGMGLHANGDLLLKASFIMPTATLASAILLTPGGLGVAEGGITGLSHHLLPLTTSEAAVAALIIRFGTLWFGVIVGLAALALISRRIPKSALEEAVVEDLPTVLEAGEESAPAS
ncbi:MAG TPA: lysylphosphatidylglycerol synthase transmembrane domain-containing protein [Dehalococcoidia bacterium]